MNQLSIAEMREAAGGLAAIDDSLRPALDAQRAVDRRDVPGGPARTQVLAAIAHAAERLKLPT